MNAEVPVKNIIAIETAAVTAVSLLTDIDLVREAPSHPSGRALNDTHSPEHWGHAAHFFRVQVSDQSSFCAAHQFIHSAKHKRDVEVHRLCQQIIRVIVRNGKRNRHTDAASGDNFWCLRSCNTAHRRR